MTDFSELIDEADPVRSAFSRLIGLPAWCVQKGHGSILTFQFGAPHLSIREPIPNPSVQNENVRRQLQRRHVVPHGEWYLWIYMCHWRCTENNIVQGTDESADADIIAAAACMDGQKLTSVEVEPASGRSKFRFDLGATLETWPYEDDNDEQWLLFTPGDHVLTYRADGFYSWAASNLSPDEERWLPLPRV
jgi:hypothetical protein